MDLKIEKRIKEDLHKLKIFKNSYSWIATGKKDNVSEEVKEVKIVSNVPVVSTDEPDNLDVFVVTDFGVTSLEKELILSPVSSDSENYFSENSKNDFFTSSFNDENKCRFINNVLSDKSLTGVQKGILLESETYKELNQKNYTYNEIALIKAILYNTFSAQEKFAIKLDVLKLFYLKVGRYEDTSSSNVHLWEDKFETMYTSFSIVQKYKDLYKKTYHANKGTGNKETTDIEKKEENTKKTIDAKPKRKENMYIGYPIVIIDLVSKGKSKNVSKKNKKKIKKVKIMKQT